MEIVIDLEETKVGCAASTADGKVKLFVKGEGRHMAFERAKRAWVQALLNDGAAKMPSALTFVEG